MMRDEKRIYRFLMVSGLITATPWIVLVVYGSISYFTSGYLGFEVAQAVLIALFASIAIATVLWLMPNWHSGGPSRGRKQKRAARRS